MNLAVSSQSFIGPRLSTDEIGPDPYGGVSTQHSTPLPPSFRVHYWAISLNQFIYYFVSVASSSFSFPAEEKDFDSSSARRLLAGFIEQLRVSFAFLNRKYAYGRICLLKAFLWPRVNDLFKAIMICSQLLHILFQVSCWGPLTEIGTYPFERYDSIILLPPLYSYFSVTENRTNYFLFVGRSPALRGMPLYLRMRISSYPLGQA